MLGILVGVDQKDNYGLVSLVRLHSCRVSSCRRQAQDARHHGRYGPEANLCSWLRFSSHCVFCPKMLVIMAGVDQKDSYAARCTSTRWSMSTLCG